jgi:hypothetical protein
MREMNKTLFSVAVVGLFLAMPSQSRATDYGMAGCGLGSMLIKDDGIVQIFAATTNGTSANQTFGITSGTSGCVADGVVMADKEQEAFAELNFEQLQHDMAQGSGEYLAAFVTLLGCTDDVRSDVYRFAQDNYAATFPNVATTPTQALYAFKIQASQEHLFAAECGRI